MRNCNHLLRNSDGSSLIEFTLVFPVFIFAALGTVDFTLMFFEWSLANKAAYLGARVAVVSNPVATGINDLSYTPALLSQPCFNPATGVANGNCPTVNTVCTPAATSGTCTNGYVWNEASITNVGGKGILDKMRVVFPRIQRQNISITYQTSGLGFVGRPNGLPMSVTVSVRCMTHQLFFINSLMGWAFPSPVGCPATTPGPRIPAFATTLPSEDMTTD